MRCHCESILPWRAGPQREHFWLRALNVFLGRKTAQPLRHSIKCLWGKPTTLPRQAATHQRSAQELVESHSLVQKSKKLIKSSEKLNSDAVTQKLRVMIETSQELIRKSEALIQRSKSNGHR